MLSLRKSTITLLRLEPNAIMIMLSFQCGIANIFLIKAQLFNDTLWAIK